MKKLYIFTLLTFLCMLISNTSCKKRELDATNKNLYRNTGDLLVVPAGTSPQYIESQLTWIARVLPYLARTVTNFKGDLQGLLTNSPTLLKHNWPSQTALLTTPMNFTSSVNSAINGLFPGNNYDSGYFFSFLYEDCVNRTLIRLNNSENISANLTKMLVCIAEYETLKDTFTGYYFDTVNNVVDSLIVHEDNAENYCIWIVEADNDCLEDNSLNATFDFNPEGHCGNGICEPFLGENPDICNDCNGRRVQGTYTLIFMEFEHLMDRHISDNSKGDDNDYCDFGYQESYFNGKYDIFFSYAVVTGCTSSTTSFVIDAWYINSIVQRTFRDWYVDNRGNETKKWTDLILKRINVGKDEVVREHWTDNIHKYSCNYCNSGKIIPVNKILSFNFVPETDYIYIDMLEWDQARLEQSDAQDITRGCTPDEVWWWPNYRQKNHRQGPVTPQLDYSDGHDLNKHLPYFWGFLPTITEPGPIPIINDYWLDGSSLFGTGAKYIDVTNNEQIWTDAPPFNDFYVGTNSSNGFATDIDKSEMRIRLVLIPNP